MILEKIAAKIKKTPQDFQPYEDLYFMCRETMQTDKETALTYLRKLSAFCEEAIKHSNDEDFLVKVFDLHRRVCLFAAPEDFDSYLLYVEWNREPDKKFYVPRRKILKQFVDAGVG